LSYISKTLQSKSTSSQPKPSTRLNSLKPQLAQTRAQAHPAQRFLHQHMYEPTTRHCKHQKENRNILFMARMQNSTQTGVHAVPRVDLEPEEEVVLVVRPYYFHDDAAKCNLRDDDAVPDAVEELEAFVFGHC